MFVSSGVKNDLGAKGGEHVLHAVHVAHIGDHYLEVRFHKLVAEFKLYFMQRAFGLVEQVYLFGTESGALPGQFATNASCCTGNEDDLVSEASCNGLSIQFDGIAFEQVLYPDTFDLI